MTHQELMPDEELMLHPVSETPLIIKEILDYNRQIIEELLLKDRTIAELRGCIQSLENELSVSNSQLKDCLQESWDLPNQEHHLETEILPQSEFPTIVDLPNLRSVRGTQILIDASIASVFKRQLNDSRLKLADVCRGMMLLITDRPRYRNMIFDRVKNGKRIPNKNRKVESFAFTYPTELGDDFIKILKHDKIKQYEAFEQLMHEFVTSYSFRKLLPDYIKSGKDRLK
jgi:hypothetical protein